MRKLFKFFGIVLAVILALACVFVAVLYFGLDTKFNERVLKPLRRKLADCPCLKKGN